MNFTSDIELKQRYVDEILLEKCPKVNDHKYANILFDAMKYSYTAPGKRIRAILLMEVYKCTGGKHIKDIESFMATIEMIHAYSLIHDDLPCMDNDDYRRGLKTCHKKFGDDIALLAGDGLLNSAFELLTNECLKDTSIDTKTKLLATKEMFHASGVYGMIGGQVVDTIQQNINQDVLNYINKNKTGALFEAAFVCGAILAGNKKETIELIRKIGRNIGLAFQIQDDILDITSTTELLGKQVGSDQKNGKITYVELNGIIESKNKINNLFDEALKDLKEICNNDNNDNNNNSFFDQLIMYIRCRKK